MSMSHMCVIITCCLSANVTLSGLVVRCLFLTGVPSISKIWFAPESAMASLVGNFTVARAMAR